MAEKRNQPLAIHRMEFRSEYHEVDSMGFVYYGAYANWFTRGRIGLLHGLGMRYAEWEQQGLYLPVLRLECDYRSPVGLDEPVQLVTELTQCTRTRMRFDYRVFRLKQAAAHEAPGPETVTGRPPSEGAVLCAAGVTYHAFIDENRRPMDVKKRFPHVWEPLMARLAGAGSEDGDPNPVPNLQGLRGNG